MVVTTVLVVTADRGSFRLPTPVTIDHDAYIEQVSSTVPDVLPLTDSQIADVEVLLASDVGLKSLLGPVSFTIQDIGPWLSGESEFIGAIVSLELDGPVSYTGPLPAVYITDFDSQKSYTAEKNLLKPYTVGKNLLEAQDIESLYILVDLKERSVVSIQIQDAASVKYDDE